jgi:hypothetical protein
MIRPDDSGRYKAHWYYGKGFPTDLHRSISEIQALGLRQTHRRHRNRLCDRGSRCHPQLSTISPRFTRGA